MSACARTTGKFRTRKPPRCSHFVLIRDILTGHRIPGSTGINARDTVAREPVRCARQTERENAEAKRSRKTPTLSPPELPSALSLRVHGVVLQVWQSGSRDVAIWGRRRPALRVYGVELQVWYSGVPDCAPGHGRFGGARDRAHSLHRMRRLRT